MDGRSWLPLVGGAEQLQAEAGWRHTFMVRRTIIAGIWAAVFPECQRQPCEQVEYSGGGAPEAAEGSEIDAEAGWEASHWCERHRHSHNTHRRDARPIETKTEFAC